MFKKNLIFNFRSFLINILLQIFLLFLLFSFVHYKYDFKIALSGLFGGIVSIFSSFCFFLLYFFYNNNISPKFIVRKFYLAGFIKFCVLFFLLLFFFKLGIYSPFCFFVFLFFVQVFFWFTCFLLLIRI